MSFFNGRTAVIATMHGKEAAIAPILEREFGLKIIVPQNFDTDQFGTFTMDIPRTGNQLEAARLKAQAVMQITGIDLAIASEGIFGPDPQMPFIQSNFELVLLVDKKNSIEIQGYHKSSETNLAGQYVSSIEEAIDFSKNIGFPEHGIIVREKEKSNHAIYKDIKTEEELCQRVSKLLQDSPTEKTIYIETDMRAHMNPTRMKKIAKATEDLALNIKSQCPDCKTPGFTTINVKKGLQCGRCKLLTDSPIAYIKKCQKCNLEKEVLIDGKIFEDPANCNWCNP